MLCVKQTMATSISLRNTFDKVTISGLKEAAHNIKRQRYDYLVLSQRLKLD